MDAKATAGRVTLDPMDVRILATLQEDGALSIASVAERVGLSNNACWRRIRRLQDQGVIKRRVALLDAGALGIGVTVFVNVRAGDHGAEWFRTFSEAVSAIPEVVEFYRMSGDADYLLKVRTPSIADYDAVYRRLVNAVGLTDVSSTFAMEEIKNTTALPLPKTTVPDRSHKSD
ncbi:MAG: Lrp/AsnC family transcriptional regulator [Phenylobacterium sp.]|uniref:Lrp/AsnC family transcriptional regulator n=1 Tax=Phenylobacterium sp. TaxID=1871053 RepID=UPI00122B3321|nr:Lrp/AsnC family transcriptional regulator [Phenylobacterium sp.]TAJ71391.1 MAG: Lrp/AsnC family transcriptional regulator [Phenylobacterium sp.]